MIVSTKPYVLIYKDGTVQNIIKENSGKVYPSATSEYAEFDTESEMNDYIERHMYEAIENGEFKGIRLAGRRYISRGGRGYRCLDE